MFDDDTPKRKPAWQVGQMLDNHSIAELDALVEDLKAEIVRIETARRAKAGHMSAAEALFVKKS